MAVAIVFTVLLSLLAVFQIALALGAPWGRFAWGGQHHGALPKRLRIASAVSVVVYTVLALPALDLAGIIDIVPNAVSHVAAWVVFGYLCIGVIMNAVSRSRSERVVMTPLAVVLALLAFVVALTGPVSHEFRGMVLDEGDGPVFCDTIMESYPPQCGSLSPDVVGWTWDSLSGVEQSGGIRWGEYVFDGVLDGDTLVVSEREPRPLR